MNSFTYENPTKVRFGSGSILNLAEELQKWGTRILFLYGGGSIKSNGMYDTVRSQITQSKLFAVEFGGVVGNPRLNHAEQAITLVRAEQIDLILAVGGGSVIDEAKAIAAGSLYDGNLWDFYDRSATITKALPIIAVQTLPATASEMNGFSVLTNEKTLEKSAIGAAPILNPKVAFLDPDYTRLISLKQTAFAVADIISHLTEGYFTTSADELLPQDELVEGLCRSVMTAAEKVVTNPNDLSARQTIMWTATLAWNGTVQQGTPGAQLPCHALEMPLSGIYDIAHGAGLAILTPHWMRAMQSTHGARICRFGKRVWGIDGTVEQVISRLGQFYATIGAPRSMSDLGIYNVDIKQLINDAVQSFSRRGISGYNQTIVRQIYQNIV